MPRDADSTHQQLLDCAQQHFLACGFMQSNIRDICKSAHVTNGAFYKHFKDKESLFSELVEPTVKHIYDSYRLSTDEHFALLDNEDMKKIWELSECTILRMIEYAYENIDIFKLILLCSKGTRYENFIHDIVSLDVEQTQKMLLELDKRGMKSSSLCEEELHILISAYYSSLAEMILHDYSKKNAMRYARTLSKFFNVAWTNILGI